MRASCTSLSGKGLGDKVLVDGLVDVDGEAGEERQAYFTPPMDFDLLGGKDNLFRVFVPKQAAGKEVVVERDVPTSSGSLKFGAIKVDQHRPDTPISRGDIEVSAMKLSPIGEDDAAPPPKPA
ncbi:hypothetical protein LIER_18505 [Lithospermum erythrorhizon]|uniref:Uncharacterized protein n=1 Tax=Lithospermum erythrorhizon TaxID=34254 RepID=A0AAV3QJN0_LITER